MVDATFDWDTCDWKQCDARDAPQTVVLLGAGASADAGLPTALELHQKVKEGLGPLALLYTNLADLVFPDGQTVDIERLFRVIQFVHALETADRASDRRLDHENLDLAQLVDTWKTKLQDYLDYQKDTVQGTASGQLIDALWDVLYDLLWLTPTHRGDIRYLRWLLMCMRGGTIATLNYDNSLEQAASSGVGVPIDANPYPTARTATMAGFADSKDAVRVIKLHGSLNWTTNSGTGHVSLLSDNELGGQRFLLKRMGPYRPPLPGIIFGAGNKLRADGPYLDLYVEFKNALEMADQLIVIGYGWSDLHINELLRGWLERFDTSRVVRVGQLHDPPPSRTLWRHWTSGNASVEVHVITGRASDRMVALTKPKPDIMRP